MNQLAIRAEQAQDAEEAGRRLVHPVRSLLSKSAMPLFYLGLALLFARVAMGPLTLPDSESLAGDWLNVLESAVIVPADVRPTLLLSACREHGGCASECGGLLDEGTRGDAVRSCYLRVSQQYVTQLPKVTIREYVDLVELALTAPF